MTLSLDDKIRFLMTPEAYAHRPAAVEFVETHMSCVFLAGDLVFKLKKPVRFPFLDFTTLAARERNCREEVRLNRRLAPGIYLGVVPLACDALQRLRLGGDGTEVDWLVEMRRLPADRMLDRLLADGCLPDADMDRLADILADFYRRAEHPSLSPAATYGQLASQHETNKALLTRPGFRVDRERIGRVMAELDRAIVEQREAIEARVEAGAFVEGHGDLRPEHVCLGDPIVIFDCLEFDRRLRLVDPFDEMAFLGMECAVRGAPWLGPALIRRVADRTGDTVPPELLRFYAAARATLRARLTLAHLLDGDRRHPGRWEPQTDLYMAFAEQALFGGGDPFGQAAGRTRPAPLDARSWEELPQ